MELFFTAKLFISIPRMHTPHAFPGGVPELGTVSEKNASVYRKPSRERGRGAEAAEARERVEKVQCRRSVLPLCHGFFYPSRPSSLTSWGEETTELPHPSLAVRRENA